jgi:hypothetical protein
MAARKVMKQWRRSGNNRQWRRKYQKISSRAHQRIKQTAGMRHQRLGQWRRRRMAARGVMAPVFVNGGVDGAALNGAHARCVRQRMTVRA